MTLGLKIEAKSSLTLECMACSNIETLLFSARFEASSEYFSYKAELAGDKVAKGGRQKKLDFLANMSAKLPPPPQPL